jgi:hypothetical protein
MTVPEFSSHVLHAHAQSTCRNKEQQGDKQQLKVRSTSLYPVKGFQDPATPPLRQSRLNSAHFMRGQHNARCTMLQLLPSMPR